ncbi:PCYCGC motif-containing (lipo)protein [Marinicrinis lubricantis]|uniref:PCYCGC motif-containing (Lipo)protein n=1 Tax=Marinicrinis lubricantis TaxID=2086470 RepID=A0ABW1INC5_9BACL
MKPKLIFFSILSLLVLSACGSNPGEQTEVHHDIHTSAGSTERMIQMPNGDIRETTASVKQLPSFLDVADEQMKAIYQLAANHAEILQWIPCYCGCGEAAGHRSNLNCFVASKEENVTLIWDDHGTRCQVCLETALISVQLAESGKSIEEIRSQIEQTYSSGFAAPTPTPLPQ